MTQPMGKRERNSAIIKHAFNHMDCRNHARGGVEYSTRMQKLKQG